VRVVALLMIGIAGCSLARGVTSTSHVQDPDAFVSGVDASTLADAAIDDAGSTDDAFVARDAWASDSPADDAGGGCFATYGSGTSFQLCSFTATSCTFYVWLGSGTACSDYCMNNGGHTCSAEIGANATDHCTSSGGAQACGHNLSAAICTCPM
jgi:hypothetical protein